MSGPVRILQVVYSMGLGGIETWLMNVLRNIDRTQFQLDFLVYTTQPQFYDEEIGCLGARILRCTHPARTIGHLRSLSHILDTEGPYRVIHAHGSPSIGSTLKSAAAAQIPVRIAHGHNLSRGGPRRLRSRLFQPLAAYWLKKHLTTGLGASEAACAHLFGSGWKSDPRCKVLFYGIDWQKYRQPVDPRAPRSALGIPPDTLVIGHVGRFVPEKNHLFLLEVASQVIKMKDDVVFLLAGDGELEPQVRQRAGQLGLEQKIIFAGRRADVPVLLQAMDVFLFPSLSEGLGIALVEAQAAGLPCVASDAIPGEATVVAGLVRRLPLCAPKEAWAKAILEVPTQDRAANQPVAWEAVSTGRFSLQANIQALMDVYSGSGI